MSRVLARTGAVIAAAVAASSAVIAIAAPAQAFENCPSGSLCSYLSNNTTGTPGKVSGDNTNLLQYSKFANAGSLANNGQNCSVAVYSRTSYTGSKLTLGRGYVINLTGTAWYHSAASNNWC